MSFGTNVFQTSLDSYGLGYNGVNVTLNYFDGLPVIQNINSKELQVLFKSLLKRDDTTKEKALNDLKQTLMDGKEGYLFEEDIFIVSWSQLYAKLASSNSKVIRSGSHEFTILLIGKLGKGVSKFLREFVPFLLAGLHDPDIAVANSCRDGLLKCFKNNDKIELLWMRFSSPLLNYIKQVVLFENEETVSDARYSTREESLLRYRRLLISAVSTLIKLLNIVELQPSQLTDLHLILSSEKLWKNISLKADQSLKLYQAILKLMVTLNDKSLFRKNKEALKLSSKGLLQSLNNSNKKNLLKVSIIFPDILTTLLAMNTYKEGRFWKYDASSKESLSQFLSLGPGVSEPVYYSLVLSLSKHTTLFDKKSFWIPLWKNYLEIEKDRKLWGKNSVSLLVECWKCFWELLDHNFSGDNQALVQNELLELLSSKKVSNIPDFTKILNDSNMNFGGFSERMVGIICSDTRKDSDTILLENILSISLGNPVLLEDISNILIQLLERENELDEFARLFFLQFFNSLLKLDIKSHEKHILKFAEAVPLFVSDTLVDISLKSMQKFANSSFFLSQTRYDLLIDFIIVLSQFDPKHEKFIRFINELPSETYVQLSLDSLVSELISEYVNSYEFDDPYIFQSKILDDTIFCQLYQNAQDTNKLQKFFDFSNFISKKSTSYIQLLTNTEYLIHEVVTKGFIDIPAQFLENKDHTNRIVALFQSKLMHSNPETHSKILDAICKLEEDSEIVKGLLKFCNVDFFNNYVPFLDSRSVLTTPIGSISCILLDEETEMNSILTEELIAFSQMVDRLLSKFPGLITHDLLLFQTWVYELVVDYNSIFTKPIFVYNNVTFYAKSYHVSFTSIVSAFFGNFEDPILESLLNKSVDKTIAVLNCRILYRILLNSAEYVSETSFEKIIVGIEKYTRVLLASKERDLISISYLGSLFCAISKFGSNSIIMDTLRNMLAAELVGIRPANDLEIKRSLVPIVLLSSLLNYVSVDNNKAPISMNRLTMALTSIESWTQSDLWYEPIFDQLRPALLQLFNKLLKFESIVDGSAKILDLTCFICKDSLDILQIEETLCYDQLKFYAIDLFNVSYQYFTTSNEFPMESLLEVIMIKSNSSLSVSNLYCKPLGSLFDKIPIKNLLPFYTNYLQLLLSPELSLSLMSVILFVLKRIITERQQVAVVEHELEKSFRTVDSVDKHKPIDLEKYRIPSFLLDVLHQKMPTDYMEFSDPDTFTRYLNYCHVLTYYFTDISYDLRQIYISQLKDMDLVDHLLNFLTDQLVLTDFKYWDEMDVRSLLEGKHDQAKFGNTSITSCNGSMLVLFNAFLSIFGSLTSTWWLNIRNREDKDSVSKFVSRYISPLLIEKELDIISSGLDKIQTEDINLNIKINRNGKEVKVSYLIDEQKLEVSFKIPVNYPLQCVQVNGISRIGISDQKWKSWILSTQRIINSMNGTVLDSIEFLSKNVKLQFSGFEECAICYYILHAIERKLPSKVCPTCKNRFHGACLYKWFKSSGNNTCPMCRGEFSLKK